MKTIANVYLIKTKETTPIFLKENSVEINDEFLCHDKFYHMYFTLPQFNSEINKIENGDWCILKLEELTRIVKVTNLEHNHPIFNVEIEGGCAQLNHLEKIIATTDDLSIQMYNSQTGEESYISNMPLIPKYFIEYFISEYSKGNIIKQVEVKLSKYDDWYNYGTKSVPNTLQCGGK